MPGITAWLMATIPKTFTSRENAASPGLGPRAMAVSDGWLPVIRSASHFTSSLVHQTTDEMIPGQAVPVERMPGHWPLARLGMAPTCRSDWGVGVCASGEDGCEIDS